MVMFTNYDKRSYNIVELVGYKKATGSMQNYINVGHKFGLSDFEFNHGRFNFPRVTEKSLVMAKGYLEKDLKSKSIVEGNCICFFTDPVFRSPQANDNGDWLVPRDSCAIRYYTHDKSFEILVKKENEKGKTYLALTKTTDLFKACVYFETYFKDYEDDLKWYLHYCDKDLGIPTAK